MSNLNSIRLPLFQQTLLESLVGRDPEQPGDLKLQWMNFPESWGVFVLIAVVAAVVTGVFWLYRREIDTCPRSIKLLMATMRMSVLALLILMFLKPSIFYQQVSEIKPSIVVLRDKSMSLARGDKYRDVDQAKRLAKLSSLAAEDIAAGSIGRVEIMDNAIANHPEIVHGMREKGTVRIVDFADSAEPVMVLSATTKEETEAETKVDADKDEALGADTDTDTDADTDAVANNDVGGDAIVDQEKSQDDVDRFPKLIADGLATNIWQALKVSLEDSNRVSAIVLMSEGQHNGEENPVELAEKAASLGIPIFTVGIGDPNPPRNLKISEVYVRNKAYPNEPFEVESVLQTSRRNATGLPPQVSVTLNEQRINPTSGTLENARVVKVRQIEVPEDGGRVRVDFDHVNNNPGKYVYTVAVEEMENETNLEDNRLTSSQLEVVDEKVKVLLVAGLPSWDYQQVNRLLLRDQTISLTCWLQSMDQSRPQEGNEPISQLPRNMEELGKYNVVIMMDPNPAEFDASWTQLLKDFCKYKAGGVLFMAGPQYSGEFLTLNRLEGFRDLLPVRFGDNEFIDSTQAIASAAGGDSGTMLVVNHNLEHPVMSFKADPQESREIWSLMPGISWSFPSQSAKPTARVLIERGDQISADGNQPLLVSGRYGAGSVLFFGFQGTWKWRPLGLQAQYFDRFWIQVVRFLIETRSLQGSRRGFLDREKSEYELGQRVTLVARVLDTQFQPSIEPMLEAIVSSDDGLSEKVELKLLPQQQGRYEGSFEARRPGNYEATIDLGQSLDSENPNEKLIDPVTFRVVTPSAETGSYWLNQPLMAEIAEKSGGQYLPLDQIESLPGLLPTKIERAEFNSPPKPLWDASQFVRWLVFLLPAILLSTEWVLRKYYKLL